MIPKLSLIGSSVRNYSAPKFESTPLYDCVDDRSIQCVVLKGGRGSIKSTKIAGHLITESYSMDYAGDTFLCAREVETSVDNSLYTLFETLIACKNKSNDFWFKHKCIINKYTKVKIVMVGVRVTGGKTASSQANKLKGFQNVRILWGEEAQDLSEISLRVMLPTYIRKGGIGESTKINTRFLFTMNPESNMDPVIKAVKILDKCVIVHANIFDLESRYQDKGLLALAKAQESNYDYDHVWLGKSAPEFSGMCFANTPIISKSVREADRAFLDPSFKGGDFTALSFLKVIDGKYYIWGYCWKAAWTALESNIKDLLDKYNPKYFDYEDNAIGDAPRILFDLNKMIPVTSKGNKHDRIYRSHAALKDRLRLVKGYSNSEYESQILNFSNRCEYDDAPDSLAGVLIRSGLRIHSKERRVLK